MSLHERLLAELDKPYEIWAPPNAAPPLGAQRRTLRAVVELHAPVTFMRHQLDVPICGACSAHDDLHDVPAPCSTIQAIARELGIETP